MLSDAGTRERVSPFARVTSYDTHYTWWARLAPLPRTPCGSPGTSCGKRPLREAPRPLLFCAMARGARLGVLCVLMVAGSARDFHLSTCVSWGKVTGGIFAPSSLMVIGSFG